MMQLDRPRAPQANCLVQPKQTTHKDKGSYYTNFITASKDDPKMLWQSLRKVLHLIAETVLPAHSSDKSLLVMFAFFSRK